VLKYKQNFLYFDLGSKKDCFTYGFDSVENENQLDVYCWSGSPGLREQAHEVAQAIRAGSSSTFQRTISSSSTTSSITTVPKQKQKKSNNTNQNDIDESTTFDDNSMPPPPSTSTSTLHVTAPINPLNKDVGENHPSNSNEKGSSKNN